MHLEKFNRGEFVAIKKKTEPTAVPKLPAKIDDLLQKAFTEQFLCNKYEEMFKETKSDVLTEIESSTDIEITQGEGFKTPYGSIILSERTNYKYDKDKLAALVDSGALTVDQLLQCVSTFKAEDLQKTLSTAVFETVVTPSTTETFTFKATSDFKSKCEADFSGYAPAPTTVTKTEVKTEVKVEKKQTPMLDAMKLEKAKRVAAKVNAKKLQNSLESMGVESVDDDIDAILKS
jgi:hypothetical protein